METTNTLLSFRKTLIGSFLSQTYVFLRNRLLPETILVKQKFKRRLGYEPNLRSPKTFNEKITWLKLNDRTPLHTLCADKLTVRSYVEKKIGSQYLIPLLFKSTNPDEIIPENFSDFPLILKANHDSGGTILIKDKKEADWPYIQNYFRKKLKTNYFYTGKSEWQYKNIKPYIIAEKLLLDDNGNIPFDYKLHCFNGKLKLIQVDIDRHIKHKRNLYDTDWNLLDCKYIYPMGKEVKKPATFEKMKELAEILSNDFIFARIDFYTLKDEVYFGEITFHPDSGAGRFEPIVWDKNFGELLKLPIELTER